jgi:phospholipid N-methyltransferase
MARWLPDEPDARILELGPGTGAVTQALLKQGLAENRLVAIEKSPKLASHLRHRFPQAHIITGDALDLDRLLEKHTHQVSDVAVVFSSLPLRNLEPGDATRLVDKIRAVLRPDGMLIQYSYHLGNKQASALAQFRQINSDIIWLNLPPARVTVYKEFRHRRSLVPAAVRA